MSRSLILSLTLLAACSGREGALRPGADLADPAPLADPSLFDPCAGWEGAPPVTWRQAVLAAEAAEAGRRCANGRLATLAVIYGVPQ